MSPTLFALVIRVLSFLLGQPGPQSSCDPGGSQVHSTPSAPSDDMDLTNFMPSPPDLCLLSSWDSRPDSKASASDIEPW
jgi:hypothetical protein